MKLYRKYLLLITFIYVIETVKKWMTKKLDCLKTAGGGTTGQLKKRETVESGLPEV